MYNNPNQPYAPLNLATCCDSQRLADTFTTRRALDGKWLGVDRFG